MAHEKYEPKNREEAFCFQFEDDVKMLHSVALVGESYFKQGLETLKTHIAAYEQLSENKQ